MSDCHEGVPSDYEPGCAYPESPNPGGLWFMGSTCRSCMIGLVASAVNQPWSFTIDREGISRTAPEAALLRLQNYDEFDPLRVRAEQVLVPLIEGAA